MEMLPSGEGGALGRAGREAGGEGEGEKERRRGPSSSLPFNFSRCHRGAARAGLGGPRGLGGGGKELKNK